MNTTKKFRSPAILNIRHAASALAVVATLAGTTALADHGEFRDGYRQLDEHRYGPIRSMHTETIRVRVPVRVHGAESLPLGRMIRRNSGLNMKDYRLVAVVISNGRFSNGYASLRTGKRTSQRYFLGGYSSTRIPAPSRADDKWRLRLGPGTQVRSVTAILEPRRTGWSHGTARARGSRLSDQRDRLAMESGVKRPPRNRR